MTPEQLTLAAATRCEADYRVKNPNSMLTVNAFMDGRNDALNAWRKDKEAFHLAAEEVIAQSFPSTPFNHPLTPFLLTPPVDAELMAEANHLTGASKQHIYDRLVALRAKGAV